MSTEPQSAADAARLNITAEIKPQEAPRPDLWAALAKAQAEIKNVSKNRTVKVTMRNGGQYSYAYATLDNVLEAIRAPLAKNGLSVVQVVVPTPRGNWLLRTVLGHASGQELTSEMPIFVEQEEKLRAMQALGSAVTFARRYALQNLFMLAADDDDDANAGEGEVTPRQKPQPNMREPSRKAQAPALPAKPQAAPAPKSEVQKPAPSQPPPPDFSGEPWPDSEQIPDIGSHLGDAVIKIGSPRVKGRKLRDLSADELASEWEYWRKNAKTDQAKAWAQTLELYMNSLG